MVGLQEFALQPNEPDFDLIQPRGVDGQPIELLNKAWKEGVQRATTATRVFPDPGQGLLLSALPLKMVTIARLGWIRLFQQKAEASSNERCVPGYESGRIGEKLTHHTSLHFFRCAPENRLIMGTCTEDMGQSRSPGERTPAYRALIDQDKKSRAGAWRQKPCAVEQASGQ